MARVNAKEPGACLWNYEGAMENSEECNKINEFGECR